MANAHNLFEYQGCTTSLAHRNDPATSYDAADKMVKSRALTRQEQWVYNWFLHYSKLLTARELAKKISANLNYQKCNNFHYLDFRSHYFLPKETVYYIVQRRLSGLRNKGKIGRVRKDGGLCCGPKPLTKYLVVRDRCCVWRLKK